MNINYPYILEIVYSKCYISKQGKYRFHSYPQSKTLLEF